jgi:hypothetical protein
MALLLTRGPDCSIEAPGPFRGIHRRHLPASLGRLAGSLERLTGNRNRLAGSLTRFAGNRKRYAANRKALPTYPFRLADIINELAACPSWLTDNGFRLAGNRRAGVDFGDGLAGK